MQATIALLNPDHQKIAENLLKGFAEASEEVVVTGVDGATYVVTKIPDLQRTNLESAFHDTNAKLADGQMSLAFRQ